MIPARGGDVIKLFLVKRSIPNATYPAVGAAICVEAVFDAFMAVFILTFAFSQGVFPKPPDFAKINAFDLSFLAEPSEVHAVSRSRRRRSPCSSASPCCPSA